MTANSPEQVAEELIERFRAAIWKHSNPNHINKAAIECAILHLQGIIDVLNSVQWMVWENVVYDFDNEILPHWQKVKDILQSK